MGAPLLIIAAGGTGGHMFPAQALAEEMLARGWRVKLSTDARGARYAGGFPDAVEVTTVASATFARGGVVAKAMVPLRILSGAVAAWRAMGRDRPAVVAGFGGYPAIPAMLAAGARRVPRIIHEQNGVLGRVNRLFARRVDGFACGTWPTRLPDGVVGTHVGNPVRAAVLAKLGWDYDPPQGDPIRILVIGGSQGARILSQVVPAAVMALPDDLRNRVEITQQARPEDLEAVRATYADTAITAEVSPFIDDIPDRLARAALVIGRAGASSVAEIAAIGRPSILIPYAAATGDHQTANASGLAGANAAIVIPEAAFDAPALTRAIAQILTDPQAATRMAQAARAIGKPEAAKTLADMVEHLKG